MIDYDKLKIAHALADKYASQKDVRCELIHRAVIGSINDSWVVELFVDAGRSFYGNDIDRLIALLKESTQPEPKYKVGCKAYAINHDNFELVELIIESVAYSNITESFNYAFVNSFILRGEDDLYPTKADLIEAQLEYWSNMREPQDEYCNVSGVKLVKREPTEGTTGCQHETNSKIKPYKCIKCGEFYR